MFAAMFLGLAVAAEITFPGVIELQSGDLTVQLKGSNAGSISAIRYKGTLLTNGASGMVLAYAGKGYGFVGAGRIYKNAGGTVVKEALEGLTIKVDGKEVDWNAAKKFTGALIEVEKKSRIEDVDFVQEIRLDKDGLAEKVTLTPAKEVKIARYYHIVSWNSKFNNFRAGIPGGLFRDGILKADNKFVVQAYCPALILVNETAGVGVASIFTPAKGFPEILLWDRGVGATEHYVAATGKTWAANTPVSYQHKIVFAAVSDADDMQDAAGL